MEMRTAAIAETEPRFRPKLKRSMSTNDLPPESPNPNRRQFLLTTGSALAAGVIAAYTPADATSSAANDRVTATGTACHFSLEISEPLA
jgi:ferric-dicitrate binding protein FerR (iron transport regulator)